MIIIDPNYISRQLKAIASCRSWKAPSLSPQVDYPVSETEMGDALVIANGISNVLYGISCDVQKEDKRYDFLPLLAKDLRDIRFIVTYIYERECHYCGNRSLFIDIEESAEYTAATASMKDAEVRHKLVSGLAKQWQNALASLEKLNDTEYSKYLIYLPYLPSLTSVIERIV